MRPQCPDPGRKKISGIEKFPKVAYLETMKTLILYLLLLLLSYTAGFYINPLAFLLALVLGLNVLQSAFTGMDPLSYLTGYRKESTEPVVPPAD